MLKFILRPAGQPGLFRGQPGHFPGLPMPGYGSGSKLLILQSVDGNYNNVERCDVQKGHLRLIFFISSEQSSFFFINADILKPHSFGLFLALYFLLTI